MVKFSASWVEAANCKQLLAYHVWPAASAPSRYISRAAKRLIASRCTHSDAAVSQREKSVQIPGSEGMNCGLKPPALGSGWQAQHSLEHGEACGTLWSRSRGHYCMLDVRLSRGCQAHPTNAEAERRRGPTPIAAPLPWTHP